jgi:hypothetical protein
VIPAEIDVQAHAVVNGRFQEFSTTAFEKGDRQESTLSGHSMFLTAAAPRPSLVRSFRYMRYRPLARTVFISNTKTLTYAPDSGSH